MNPSSESILELGTRVHPYKNINLPLFELFNFVNGNNSNISIRLSQDDTHYLVIRNSETNIILQVIIKSINN